MERGAASEASPVALTPLVSRLGRGWLFMIVIALLAVSVLAVPLAPGAQVGRKIPAIGFIEAGSASVNRHFADAFRRGLTELGYIEGQNIAIEERWADGRTERFPDLLADLLRLKIDVVVQASSVGALAAKQATTTVPVVFVGVSDPIGRGLVRSLAHPGGNLTGLSLAWGEGLAGKWVELLKRRCRKSPTPLFS